MAGLTGTSCSVVVINDLHCGTECIISKFADDAKLSSTVNTIEGRDATQGDLDKLEKWVHVNLMWFNKAKCKVLSLGWSNPSYDYKLGKVLIERHPTERDLRILMDEKLGMS